MSSTGVIPLKPWTKWGLVFGFWTLIGLSFASQFYLSGAKAGSGVSWRQALGWALGDWYVFALLAVPVAWLTRRFPLAGGTWPRSLAVHLPACACFSLLFMVLRTWVGQWQSWAAGQSMAFGAGFQPLLVKTWHFNLVIYWVIVSVLHAFDYYRKYQERTWRAVELEKRLAEARLLALQMQINPHFLFNTLHAIAALMHKDVEAADRMIVRLSELLRHALESGTAQEVPLRQELDFLQRYLEIEQTRFGDRLRVHMDVEPAALGALVPNLILQPLVENAIRHGIEPHARPGTIELRARREAASLRVEVSDNGTGLGQSQRPAEGVGLANTRARLQQLYGARQQLEFDRGPQGGLRVALTLPLKTTETAP